MASINVVSTGLGNKGVVYTGVANTGVASTYRYSREGRGLDRYGSDRCDLIGMAGQVACLKYVQVWQPRLTSPVGEKK